MLVAVKTVVTPNFIDLCHESINWFSPIDDTSPPDETVSLQKPVALERGWTTRKLPEWIDIQINKQIDIADEAEFQRMKELLVPLLGALSSGMKK